MKKTYFSPETEVVLLNTIQPILAGSISDPDDITDGPVPTDDNPSDGDLDW